MWEVIYPHSIPLSHFFQDEKLRDVIRAIQSCKHQISDSLKKISDPTEADIIRVHSYGHVLRVFEVEMLCVQKDWPGLKSTIDVSRIIPLYNYIEDRRHSFYIGNSTVRWIRRYDLRIDCRYTGSATIFCCIDLNSSSFSKWSEKDCPTDGESVTIFGVPSCRLTQNSSPLCCHRSDQTAVVAWFIFLI